MNNLCITFTDRTGLRTLTGTIDRVVMYPNGMFGVYPTGMNRELKYETTSSTEIIIEPIMVDEFLQFSY